MEACIWAPRSALILTRFTTAVTSKEKFGPVTCASALSPSIMPPRDLDGAQSRPQSGLEPVWPILRKDGPFPALQPAMTTGNALSHSALFLTLTTLESA